MMREFQKKLISYIDYVNMLDFQGDSNSSIHYFKPLNRVPDSQIFDMNIFIDRVEGNGDKVFDAFEICDNADEVGS